MANQPSPATPITAAYSFAALSVEQAYEQFGTNIEPDVSLEVLRIIDMLIATAEAADNRTSGINDD